MSDASAILFLHKGGVPAYLQAVLESARYFNPEARIFLIGDPSLPFSKWGVEKIGIDELTHPLLPAFLRSYVHISGNGLEYERLCFERWFYIDAVMQRAGVSRVVYLDSDCVLFANVSDWFDALPAAILCANSRGVPSCSFLQGSLKPFLQFILDKYQDSEFLGEHQKRSDAAIARGAMDGVTDMTLIRMFTASHPAGAIYPSDQAGGHLDKNIFIPDGMECRKVRRHGQRKKIYWEDDGQTFTPYFKKEETNGQIRALCVHFQGGAKRKICRFNRVNELSPWPRSWRLAWYKFLLG